MNTERRRIKSAGKPVASRGLRSRRHRRDRYFRVVAYVITTLVAAIIVLSVVNPGSRMLKFQPAGPPSLNDCDPFSGKPVGKFSPRATYENHTIGFCCSVSMSKWAQLPKVDKDAFVRRFDPQPESAN